MEVTTFINWVQTQVGLTAIWANGNAPRPPRPYVTLNPSNMIGIGSSYKSLPDSNNNVHIRKEKTFTLNLNVIGNSPNSNDPTDPFAIANNLVDSLELEFVQNLFRSGLFFVREINAVQNVPILIGNEYVPRASFDLRIGIAVEQTESIDIIETVEGTMLIAGRSFPLNMEDL